MKKAWMVVAGLALVGCGGSGEEFFINGQKLTVLSQGYQYPVDNCSALATGQARLLLVDYTPTCDESKRKTNIEHSEIEIILGVGAHPNNAIPYEIGKVDCQLGPGKDGIARFHHYPAGSSVDDYANMMQADSGSVKVNQYAPDGTKPMMGTYTLMFGGTKVSGAFEAPRCN